MSRDGLLTIGVEEEYQIIDARGELHAHIDTLLAKAAPRLGDKVNETTIIGAARHSPAPSCSAS